MFEPVTDRSIQLADGRTLAFTEWGDLEGPPVMLFHGTPHSRLWCPDIAATQAAGAHLVIPDRPGYGRSDEPQATLTMRGWTDDMIQLADVLDLDRFGVIGWSGGATYALACAAVIPERVTVGGEVAGSGWPIGEEPGALERLTDAGRRIHALAQSDPAAAIVLVEQSAAEWVDPLREHPESIMDENDPPEDMRHFDDPAWAANFYEAITEAVRIGPRCTAWDTVAGYGLWGFGLEDVTIDFHLWHGAHDPWERQSSVDFWAGRIPGATVTVFEDSGHFAVVDHWGEILSAVIGTPG